MKRIESYSFGRIVIDGNTYTKDVIILPGRVFSPWWRKEGHLLHLEDLAEVFSVSPKVLIIGTGYSGVMRVPQEVIAELDAMGVDTRVMKTPDAVDYYNSLLEKENVVTALHLTC